MSRITHKERILRHLKTQGSITPWRALKDYGNTRLAATIHTLKKDGHKITTEIVTGVNRFKEEIKYAKYSLND